jgi:hypothetical protein
MELILMLLVLSVSLAGLTYALGALIYALPIPLRGVKKWAPILMSDAVLTVVMASMFGGILYVINLIFSLIGVSRSDLVSDVGTIANNVARLYLFFKMVQNFYNAIFSLKVFGLPIGKIL